MKTIRHEIKEIILIHVATAALVCAIFLTGTLARQFANGAHSSSATPVITGTDHPYLNSPNN